MKIVALETIKYRGENRVPGTDSAVFECVKDVAEQLIKTKKACLPQTLEQAGQGSGKDAAAGIVKDAEERAEEIVKAARDEDAEIIEDAEDKAKEIVSAAEEKAGGKSPDDQAAK